GHALPAVVASECAQDHWEIDLLANYPFRDTTAVYVADESMAASARAAGFRHVETLAWGERPTTDRPSRTRSHPGARRRGRDADEQLCDQLLSRSHLLRRRGPR